MNKAVITTIVTLSFCFNAFAQEAKGKDWIRTKMEKLPIKKCHRRNSE